MLVQFLKIYFSSQGVKTPIMICLRIAQRWLCNLEYGYKNVSKDVFVDKCERSHFAEDYKNFHKKKKEFKPYMVEFEEDGTMRPKVYSPDFKVSKSNQ